MKEDDEHLREETLNEIARALERHGAEALGGEPPAERARAWIKAGFDDPEEVEDWLRARCFDPAGARALEGAGVTPEQAAARTRAGEGGYEDTIGYKLSRGDLTPAEARRLITSGFWND